MSEFILSLLKHLRQSSTTGQFVRPNGSLISRCWQSAIRNSLNQSRDLSVVNGTYLYETVTLRSVAEGPSFLRLKLYCAEVEGLKGPRWGHTQDRTGSQIPFATTGDGWIDLRWYKLTLFLWKWLRRCLYHYVKQTENDIFVVVSIYDYILRSYWSFFFTTLSWFVYFSFSRGQKACLVEI